MKKPTSFIFPLAFLAALMPLRTFADVTMSDALKADSNFPNASTLWQEAATSLENDDYANAANKLLVAGSRILDILVSSPLSRQADDSNIVSRNKEFIARARLAYTTARSALDNNSDTGVKSYVNTVLFLLDDLEALLDGGNFDPSTWEATINVALASIEHVENTTGRRFDFDTILENEKNPTPQDINSMEILSL